MNELLKNFLMTFLTALATSLSAVVIRLITVKINHIITQTEDEKKQRFLSWIENDVIIKCINSTTQTYVDELKKHGTFNKSAQKIAIAKTTDSILKVLTEADTELLSTYVDDVSIWIATRVESYIKENKTTIANAVSAAVETVENNVESITKTEDNGNFIIEEINDKE